MRPVIPSVISALLLCSALSLAAQDKQLAWRRASVDEMKRSFDYAKLTPEAQTSYDLWIYQLSWRHRMAWVSDLADFRLLREVRYSEEGWGRTHDGTNLFATNGTHVIKVLNPETFETIRTIVVKDESGRP